MFITNIFGHEIHLFVATDRIFTTIKTITS